LYMSIPSFSFLVYSDTTGISSYELVSRSLLPYPVPDLL
jgi:hypothetical protein